MNWVERAILAVSPQWAYSRERYRRACAAYEAAKPSRLRKGSADNRSGDAVIELAGPALRGYARSLEQNYDIAKGALDVLVNNTVGPRGISREPQPRTVDGDIHEGVAKRLLMLWKDFEEHPEVTGVHDYAAMERLAARTWFRDGELLAQLLEGVVAKLNHGTLVPFSIELIEADQLPFDFTDASRGITQGVERNGWGKPLAFHVYRHHPGDSQYGLGLYNYETRRIAADRMLHPKHVSRIRQARGVSVFASVIRRLEDLKDYEESERIAARVAAALTAYVKKGASDDYQSPEEGASQRRIQMAPGMIFDDLRPGEEIGTIESNRPSALLAPFHDSMLRFASSGLGTSNSSLSRNYNGTYSAQRQELVESWGNYQVCTDLFIGQFSRPIWQRFVYLAVASGQIKVPRDLDVATIAHADFRGPAMPWIDPYKESIANKELVRSGHKSDQQVIRDRGGNPADVLSQISVWRRKARENGVVLSTDPANDKDNPILTNDKVKRNDGDDNDA